MFQRRSNLLLRNISTDLNRIMMKPLLDVKGAVDCDSDVHCRVAETEEVMKKSLPVPDDFIKEGCRAMGWYLDERWTNFLISG